MRKKIRNWEELAAIPNESETHIIDVDLRGGYAWILSKENDEKVKLYDGKDVIGKDIYLSTHSFYSDDYQETERILNECGFDVEIVFV